ncbi:MAG: 3-phosphoshikimate 1-carboxyvinyltransferase [Acidimicrobiia bacterium]
MTDLDLRDLRHLPDPFEVEPVGHPLEATVRVPGSKSLTNRALVAAALARGPSVLRGALQADDTEAMVDGLRGLGVEVRPDWATDTIEVEGCAGRPPAEVGIVDARLSGTTSRFLLPVAALGSGTYRVDGGVPLRARPMGPALDALRRLGVTVAEVGEPGHLPVDLSGGPVRGGAVDVPGDTSSQFLSGLLLAAPAMAEGLEVWLTTELVSRPYVEMTAAVVRAFGGDVAESAGSAWVVAPSGYAGTDHRIEPDASAASYFFAAAAICGGRVTVEGLGDASLQGDLAFVDVLARMGARVERGADAVTVEGTGTLHGVEADLADLSDTAQTLAAVAVYADSPTRITGIGFIRNKETDRIGATVAELTRCGVQAVEEPDGMVVWPGSPRPATVETYDDHRMAMSFAVLGLRAPGIRIADPGCVAKTFPGFWATLATLA